MDDLIDVEALIRLSPPQNWKVDNDRTFSFVYRVLCWRLRCLVLRRLPVGGHRVAAYLDRDSVGCLKHSKSLSEPRRSRN